MDLINFINSTAWVIGNILIAYIAIGVIAFVTGYYILFDPRATMAGKFIFRFFLSLVGLIMLVFLGTFVDPAANRVWLELPADVDTWRPILRLIVYGYVAYTITSLAILLAVRKWRPSKVHSNREMDLVKPRYASESPTIQTKE